MDLCEARKVFRILTAASRILACTDISKLAVSMEDIVVLIVFYGRIEATLPCRANEPANYYYPEHIQIFEKKKALFRIQKSFKYSMAVVI